MRPQGHQSASQKMRNIQSVTTCEKSGLRNSAVKTGAAWKFSDKIELRQEHQFMEPSMFCLKYFRLKELLPNWKWCLEGSQLSLPKGLLATKPGKLKVSVSRFNGVHRDSFLGQEALEDKYLELSLEGELTYTLRYRTSCSHWNS